MYGAWLLIPLFIIGLRFIDKKRNGNWLKVSNDNTK